MFFLGLNPGWVKPFWLLGKIARQTQSKVGWLPAIWGESALLPSVFRCPRRTRWRWWMIFLFAEPMELTAFVRSSEFKLWMNCVHIWPTWWMLQRDETSPNSLEGLLIPIQTIRSISLACRTYEDWLQWRSLAVAWDFFSALALPFRATGSVTSFLRINLRKPDIHWNCRCKSFGPISLTITLVSALRMKNAMSPFTLSPFSDCLGSGLPRLVQRQYRSAPHWSPWGSCLMWAIFQLEFSLCNTLKRARLRLNWHKLSTSCLQTRSLHLRT